MDNPVIIFDGVCNLCNSSVAFIIKHDPNAVFRFIPSQAGSVASVLTEKNDPAPDSIILLENNRTYTRSTAALRIARRLSGPVKLLYGFIIVPAFIRNAVYDLIARNRYKWFGKKEQCMVPSPDVMASF